MTRPTTMTSAELPNDLPAEFQPFPVAMLPEPLARFVIELAEATGNEPACAALAALVVVAGVIGNRVAAHVKGGWTEPAVLWGAIVARSGSTKSAVLKLATRPLLAMYKEARQQFSEELASYEVAQQRYEVELAQWKAAQKSGDGDRQPPTEPQRPIEKRLVVSDVTCEKLGVLLEENPLGLLLFRDELAAWIGSFDRYASGGKGSDSPTWLSLFDAGNVVIDRKSHAGSIFVERASVSVLGSIQPGTLRRVFGAAERESGLLARVLMVQPPSQAVFFSDNELSEAGAQRWADLLRALLQLKPKLDEHGKPLPRLVGLSPAARQLYAAWHDTHAPELVDVHADDLTSHLAKLKGICIRFSLLFACVEAAVAGRQVEEIDEEHLSKAIAVTDWFWAEAKRIYSQMNESDEQRQRRQLLELIQRHGDRITVRQLQQSSRRYKTAAQAREDLDALVRTQQGWWDGRNSGRRGGRPRDLFYLNPRAPEPAADITDDPSVSTKPLLVDQEEGFVDVDTVDIANPGQVDAIDLAADDAEDGTGQVAASSAAQEPADAALPAVAAATAAQSQPEGGEWGVL